MPSALVGQPPFPIRRRGLGTSWLEGLAKRHIASHRAQPPSPSSMTHSEPLDVSVLLKPAKEFILPGNAKWPLVSLHLLFQCPAERECITYECEYRDYDDSVICVHRVHNRSSFTNKTMLCLSCLSRQIFIGPGTGVSPFMGFMQHRLAKRNRQRRVQTEVCTG